MNGKVKVLGDDQGNIIKLSKNPEYGFVQLEQINLEFNGKGWLKKVRRVTNVHGTIDDLKLLNLKKGDALPGKIVIKEALTPFNEKDPDSDLKYAGKTGVICRFFDEPIYRQSFYTENSNELDEFVQHTNTDEIREAMIEVVVNEKEEEVLNF